MTWAYQFEAPVWQVAERGKDQLKPMEISISVVFNVGDWFWNTSLHKFLYHLSTKMLWSIKPLRMQETENNPLSPKIHEKKGQEKKLNIILKHFLSGWIGKECLEKYSKSCYFCYTSFLKCSLRLPKFLWQKCLFQHLLYQTREIPTCGEPFSFTTNLVVDLKTVLLFKKNCDCALKGHAHFLSFPCGKHAFLLYLHSNLRAAFTTIFWAVGL